MIAEASGAAMAANDGGGADVDGIIEAAFASMAEINHDTPPVHLLHHFLSKPTDTVVGVASLCAVADVIVAIMAQGYIHHAPLGEMLYVGDVAIEGYTILYAEHYGLAPFPFVLI